ncbi:MAG: hypothetical protein M1825_001953 [Sarcosagium campestre]|nr:MAG: hypothetical protein M1825_001953 [Sarcosagium campestre]
MTSLQTPPRPPNSTPSTSAPFQNVSGSPFNQYASNATTGQTSSPGQTFLMPSSPLKGRRVGEDAYWPTVLNTTGHMPACLVNACLTYCGDDQIYAFGGFDQYTDEVYNHVLKLDLKTLTWSLVDNYGDIPGVRMGHTATLYQGHKLLIYGGENEHRQFLSDIIIFDVRTAHWTQPAVSGPVPKGRARHAAALHNDRLFIVGGVTGPNNSVLNDVCYLDLKTMTWSKTWRFVGRFDHTAWVWLDRLWLFGGLGEDMDRGGEIWWMDLQGDPALRDSTPQLSRRGSTAHLDGQTTPSPFAKSGTGHAANSSSLQSKTSPMRRTYASIAHGAISSTNFVLNPGLPSQASGTHFHTFTSGTLLDFATPASTIRPSDCCLSALKLDSLRWQKLAQGAHMFNPGYSWHYCVTNEDGTKAWMLGCKSEVLAAPDANFEDSLCNVLPIDLTKFGVVGNSVALAQSSISTAGTGTQSLGLGGELGQWFDKSAESGGFADFIITAEADEDVISGEDYAETDVPRTWPSGQKQSSSPIHTHKLILSSRWPYFRRLYSAQMAEFHSNRMHIPEPYSVVKAFLYYLYTDSIAPHPDYCPSLREVAGMLVMANVYDMPALRVLCVRRLLEELDVENAPAIWEKAGMANDHALRRRAASFCLQYWGRVVRTSAFRELSRSSLMELCEEVDSEGAVVRGEDLDVVGSSSLGPYGQLRRPLRMTIASGRSQLGEEMTDDPEDDDDGMEMN